tara:strand:- start:208 stop:477 length:270 start_codon:yes stop_codon:yes gene_type:complete
MKYKLSTKYAWYNQGQKLILLYCIQDIPFTFDELPEIAKENPEVLDLANNEHRWEVEEMYRASMYLMAEECHPMMFELELENPELMPVE